MTDLSKFTVICLSLALFAVGIYACWAYCLGRIAERTSTDHAWWAWVPPLNLLLHVKIAEKPMWWALLLLVPIVNVVIAIKIFAAICRRCGASPWFSALMFVPGLNLLAFAVLADISFRSAAKAVVLLFVPLLPALVVVVLEHSLAFQLRSLTHRDADVRYRAAAQLAWVCPNIGECIGPLTAALKDPEADVRSTVVNTLMAICPKTAECVPALTSALKDPAESVRLNASYALTRLGPTARGATLALKEALADPSENVRKNAATALKAIDLH